MPALAIIDVTGKISFMHYADLPGDIPQNQEVLALIEKLNQEAQSQIHP